MSNTTLSSLHSTWRERENKIDLAVKKLRAQGVTQSDDFEQKLKAEFGDEYPNYWFKVICEPIAQQIKEAGGFERVDVLGPMGIGARISFHCYQTKDQALEKIKSLTVDPDLEISCGTALRKIDYSKKSDDYAKGTLGEVNGLNYGLIEIDPDTSGEQWLALLD